MFPVGGKPIDANYVKVSEQPEKIAEEHPAVIFCNLLGFRNASPVSHGVDKPFFGERLQLKADGSSASVKSQDPVLSIINCSDSLSYDNIGKVTNPPARTAAPPAPEQADKR